MEPMESSGAMLWGAKVGLGEKNAHTVAIEEGMVAVLSGICIDHTCPSTFKASIVVKRTDDEGNTEDLYVAMVSSGCSENVQVEIPLYKDDKILCLTNEKKGAVHVFGSVAQKEEDLGDVMDPEYAQQIQQMMPGSRLNGMDDSDEEDEDEEDSEDEEAEMAIAQEIMDDEDESDSEEDEEAVLKKLQAKLPTRAGKVNKKEMQMETDEDDAGVKALESPKNKKKVNAKQDTPKPKEAAKPKEVAKGKRKLSEASESSNSKPAKKPAATAQNGSKDAPSQQELINDIKGWIDENGGKLNVQNLGHHIQKKYHKGFKKLGFGGKVTEFLMKAGDIKVDKSSGDITKN